MTRQVDMRLYIEPGIYLEKILTPVLAAIDAVMVRHACRVAARRRSFQAP